jgi:serine/threonine-protein kinase
MRRLLHRARRFFLDLRRRRVFRVAAAYLAIAFIVLQVAEIVFPALGQDRGLTIAVVLAIIGFPVTLVLAWLYDLSPLGLVRTAPLPDEDEDDAGAPEPAIPLPADPERRKAVAVLPFRHVGGDPDDRWFSDGIHEDVLTGLSKISDLRVVSRNAVLRYREGVSDMRRLGRELGVGTVLEGSVRRSGTRVRIVARLVDADTDQNVWAETYDRSLDDIFRIQEDVARHIARSLRAELSDEEEERIASAPTQDLAAYDLYLRGRYLWNERTEKSLQSAAELLERAVAQDPGFALAHAGRADVYLTLALYNQRPPGELMPLAEEAATRALELEPGLSEARAARGCVRALYRWDWAGGLEDLTRAAAATPPSATAWQWRAIHVLAPLQRFAEAHEDLARACALDPASPAIHATRVFLLYLERRYDEAEAACRSLLADVPSFALGHQFLGQVLHRQARSAEASLALERASELRGRTPEARAALAVVRAATGQEAEARALLDELGSEGESRYVSPTRLAQIRLALGDVDEAFQQIEQALERRSTDLAWIRSDPAFDDARADPRFERALETMGLATGPSGGSGPPPDPGARSPR